MTVMVKFTDTPVHPFNEGVTVTIPEIGTVPPLVVIKLEIFPVPDVPSPIAGLEFVQLKTVFDNGPVKLKLPLCCPAHTAVPDKGFTAGRGLTVTLCEVVVVPHSFVTAKFIV